ncbi:acyl-CoA synthetase family member 2, mitochondrial [Acrasis kona]|uniref:Acyl-CoA synthetase family member 2, mitochondrial n=1 Tax=Acrasis kona TaxID=1008807 RepID=A0AAW2YYZ7_9EUKA
MKPRGITKLANRYASTPKRTFFDLSNDRGLTKAHVIGDTSEPLLTETIGENYKRQVNVFGSRNVINCAEQKISETFSELDENIIRVSTRLLQLGYKKGDRIGIFMPNNYEWILLAFACMHVGIILTNLNPAYRLTELEHAINLSECKGLVIVPNFKSSDYISMVLELCPELMRTKYGTDLHSKKLPSLRHVWHCGPEGDRFYGVQHINDLLNCDKDFAMVNSAQTNLSCHDVINIQFTSGTTGKSKAAALTHSNILNNGYFVGGRMNLSEVDRICIPVPLFHCFGLVLGVLACVTHGSSFVLPGASFDAMAALQATHDYECTGLHGVPTMFTSYLEKDLKKYNFNKLRTGIMAGSTCPIVTMQQCIDVLNLRDMTICYGMTETSPVSFQSSIDDPVHRRVTTIGKIHPHVECKVINPTTGETCDVNVPGELCTKGYLVMKEYWAQPQATKDAIDEDGFMHTGDMAIIDKEGYASIVGRIKDLIIRGGENISPREIEEFLMTNNKVSNVSVVGVYDSKFGEQVCAWIILKKGQVMTESDVVNFCREKVAHYKIPKYIFFTETFPMTLSGKVQKFVLRDDANQRIHGKKSGF